MAQSHKKGCLRKGCIIPAASIALLIAIFVGREVYLAYTATPGSAVDYHALAEELVASHQPTDGPNGWDRLTEALERRRAFREQIESPDELDEGYTVLMGPVDPEDYEGGDQDVARLRGVGESGLAGLREAGVREALDQLAASSNFIRPLPKGGVLLDVLLPELGEARSLARALGAQMRVSSDARDHDAVAAAFNQGCGLARALMHQFTLIDNLVGIAIFQLLSDELRHEIATRPMDQRALAEIADALDRMTTLPPQLPFQGERLFMLDTIQWMHTDDGHGDGRLILSQVGGLQSFSWGARTNNSPWKNLASLAFPTKRQTTRQAEDFYKAVIKAAQTPRNARRAGSFNPDAFAMQIPKRQLLLRLLVPALGKALETRDQFDALLAGTRTMVAIERFKLRDGTYPQSLDQLTPDFLPSLPIDPYAADGRFIYRTLDPTADEFHRAYILYSVAADQTDNGGTHDPELGIKAFSQGATAVDFVFNLPRQEP
jgi:hypothetical protein